MDPGFKIRELFHLLALRQISTRLAHRPYAVKGGICLRFFHRSPRLSEDMDLDVSPDIPVKTLERNVDAVFSAGALAASLRSHGVHRIEFSKPKQTETTQRWKAGLVLASGPRLNTRVEFSRRSMPLSPVRGTPNPDILREAFMAPFAAAHYDCESMVQQKLLALASPTRTAARDLFDLHHLLFQTHAKLDQKLDSAVLDKATEKIGRFDYSDFRDQVLPYLPEGLKMHYGDHAAFQRMREEVEHRLLEVFG